MAIGRKPSDMNEYLKYYKQLLTSWSWRKLRRRKLNQNVFCERCVAEGKAVPNFATDVHHITPVMSVAPDKGRMKALFYDPHNLQALCPECHKKTHDEMKLHVSKDKREEIRKKNLSKFESKFFAGAVLNSGGG